MKKQIIAFVLGFAAAGLALGGIVFAFLFWSASDQPVFRDQKLPSGKEVQVASFNLAWGVEHDERRKQDDQFSLSYVSRAGTDAAAQEREAWEVFELIRPVSEQWGFRAAAVAAFPTQKRKGPYDIYNFTRTDDGKWSYKKMNTKVFSNE